MKIAVRSTLKCEATVGVCQQCYGRAMATGKTAMIGDAVGIVAAQSIGEPGTQLTMRTFHTGGVAGADITHGLPRVVELFEARKPKGLAKIAEVSGTVSVEDTDKARTIVVTDEAGEEHRYPFPRRTRLHVAEGEVIEAGKQLNEGSLYPHELLDLRGRTDTEVYLVKEVQEVYKSQGVDIHDKHIELIVRQMLKKIRVEQKGDTDLLPGQFVDRHEFKRINDKVIAAGGEPAVHAEIILGITKASLATDSFLSAASFQETTKVLTDAALEGKIDRLAGLKENVIIGKLIPAATGLKRYRGIEIEPSEPLPRGIDDVGLGRTDTEVYLVKEVQEVYKSQGVDIHDKHIELIVRQMLKKIRVEQKGDTDLLPGQFVDRHEFKRINDKVIAEGGEPAVHAEIILGITKASLATDSFLSAASFQETTKVLTDAALEGKIDRLAGLKENVIIGKLIPAATGLKRYRGIEIEPSEPLPRGIDDVGLLEGDDLAAELGLGDDEGLQGFGPAFDTTELDEINAGFGPAGGSFDDIGADLGERRQVGKGGQPLRPTPIIRP